MWWRWLFLVDPALDPTRRDYRELAQPEDARRCECEENGGPCRCWARRDDEEV
jgi:hypothetical protein